MGIHIHIIVKFFILSSQLFVDFLYFFKGPFVLVSDFFSAWNEVLSLFWEPLILSMFIEAILHIEVLS